MFVDEQKTLMTFEYFLETSKLIYEVNFMNQKRYIEEGIKKRRELLGRAKDKKATKTSSKQNMAELEASKVTYVQRDSAMDKLIPVADELRRLKQLVIEASIVNKLGQDEIVKVKKELDVQEINQ